MNQLLGKVSKLLEVVEKRPVLQHPVRPSIACIKAAALQTSASAGVTRNSSHALLIQSERPKAVDFTVSQNGLGSHEDSLQIIN